MCTVLLDDTLFLNFVSLFSKIATLREDFYSFSLPSLTIKLGTMFNHVEFPCFFVAWEYYFMGI